MSNLEYVAITITCTIQKVQFEYKYNYCLYKVIKLQLQITTQVIKLVI